MPTDRETQLEDFLRAPRVMGRKCETCNDSEEVKNAVQAYAIARRENRTKQPFAAFHKFMCDVYGCTQSLTALRNHVTKCLGGFDNGIS